MSVAGNPATVRAVMACFNRKAKTLACLDALGASADAARDAGVVVDAVVLDDGSTDGTAQAVREASPSTQVIDGQGGLFWTRGMHQAFAKAMERGANYYLWLNDDTVLVAEAIERLVGLARQLAARGRPGIVVGTTVDASSGQPTYGGVVARGWFRRFSYRLVSSEHEPLDCDTFNGNCVLIPHEVATAVGNLDPVYEHAMGDTDYGLRARRAGYPVVVCPGAVGTCSRNPADGTYQDRSLPIGARWNHLLGPKGLPVKSWLHFTRQHGGLLWWAYFVWPYAKVIAMLAAALLLFMLDELW